MKDLKWIGIAILTIACISCEMQKKEKTEEEQKVVIPPTPVEAVQVSKGVILHHITASGVAAGIRESYVVSEAQGKITQDKIKLGNWVKKGQTLIKVNDVIQKAALKQAEKTLAVATLNLDVTQKLYKNGNASNAELTNSQSQTTGAQANLEAAKKTYEDCHITAPISGYIAQKDLSIGKGNLLGGGTMVARIVNIVSLKTTISIGEMEIGFLKKGMKVNCIIPAVGNYNFVGKIYAIAAGSDPATGSFPVEILWKNTSDLTIKSGMSVRVTIESDILDSVMLIPTKAIVEKDRKDAVFIATDDKAGIRFVTLGRSIGNRIEIVKGLSIGDILIISGITKLVRGETIVTTVIGESGGLE